MINFVFIFWPAFEHGPATFFAVKDMSERFRVTMHKEADNFVYPDFHSF